LRAWLRCTCASTGVRQCAMLAYRDGRGVRMRVRTPTLIRFPGRTWFIFLFEPVLERLYPLAQDAHPPRFLSSSAPRPLPLVLCLSLSSSPSHPAPASLSASPSPIHIFILCLSLCVCT